MTSDSLPELLAIVATSDFKDNGQMRVDTVEWSGSDLTVGLQLDHGTDEKSAWELRFTGVLEHLFADVSNCGLNVWHVDHPVLDQYVQPRESLHFASAPRDAMHVIGELWVAHRELVDDWIPFDRYLNDDLPLERLLASGSGLLATGPTFLIARYADILKAQGCRPRRRPVVTGRVVESATLTHFGESYVVAARVMASRVAA